MELPEALIMVKRLIDTGEKHQDYKRVTDLAETYRIYITGEDISKKLRQYVRREDKEMYEQRLAMTKSITPAVASSIRQPFNKVTRNDRIRKSVTLKDKTKGPIVEKMIRAFHGSARKKNRGLDYWMKTRFVDMEFIDPNSWLVMEWDGTMSLGEPILPRPFEVNSKEAIHYFSDNDEVKWLLVQQDIKYIGVTGATGGTGLNQSNLPGVITPTTQKQPGCRFTLYDEKVTVVFEQVDKAYLTASGYVLKGNEFYDEVKATTYLVKTFTPKVGFAPVFRIGYKRDDVTNSRTFVNPWHDALCYFDKSLKTVSELDLTMTLHAFPQKLQYVQKCPGTKEKRCNRGFIPGGGTCEACKGSGYKLHTTAQDAILLPMPETAQDMINLDDILVYKAPPVELIKFQNEYTQQLERQAHQAVYNSQVFVKKAGASGGTGQPIQTATEADFNMQSVYDALEPFTEKLSELWKDIVTVFAILANEKLDNIEAIHEFPADYKLKTGDILLAERKTAKDSGAPAFLIETIDSDLATIIYAGDALGLSMFRTKAKFWPFSGKTEDEIAGLLTSPYVLEESKVLYSNFDLIFKEIEQEHPEIWTLKDYKKQQQYVTDKVTEFMQRLETAKAAAIVNAFNQANPAGDGGGNPGTGGNPADPSTEDPLKTSKDADPEAGASA